MAYPYTVHNPDGELVLQAAESARYSRRIELDLLGAGYTIRLHGKRITRVDLRKEMPRNAETR